MNFSWFVNKKKVGDYYEKIALKFLKEKGYILVEKNFYSKYGEIDLIVSKKKHIVFVEVRFRQVLSDAIESVSRKKIQRIHQTALFFLQQNQTYSDWQSRFDLIVIDESQQVGWLKNII